MRLRLGLIATATLVACKTPPTLPPDTLGSVHYVHDPSKPDPRSTRADAHLPARLAFENPGGMWLPSQMLLPQHVEKFKKLGVAIEAKQLADPLADPLAAIVSLGGCTGSFVSGDGLIVTNHHCAQTALQQNATKDDNIVETGFTAKTLADERPAGAAQRVLVVQSYKDVTRAMRDGLEQIGDPVARKEESERRAKALIASCEGLHPSSRCSVTRLFGGGMYQLVEALEIRDVRLVYAPPRGLGNFGGEKDNWNWPRHTGDWSFLRAYVGKDGAPADQLDKNGKLADNVPYHPKHFLTVSTHGVKPGDFAMVIGYPGRTERIVPASVTHHDIESSYPYEIANLEERYAILQAHLGDPGETGIKATVEKQRAQNYIAKDKGILAGLSKGDLLAKKDALDAKIKEWASQPGREAYAQAIARHEAILADEWKTEAADRVRKGVLGTGSSKLLGVALSVTRWADERQKPDAERKPDYQLRDMSRAVGAAKQLAKSYDPTLDRALFKMHLMRALALPEADRPWLALLLDAGKKQKIDEALIDKTLDAWYKGSALPDLQLRLDLLQRGTLKDLKASKDPFIAAAQRVWGTVKAAEKVEDARAGELLLVAPYYADAMSQVLNGFLSPDANGTLRVTYGTVRSFKPGSKDPADSPFTVASQIPGKATGTPPFNAPDKELAAIRAKDFGPYADPALNNDLPVDFLTDVDITNGNSGSPTLDGKGELIGLAFDGTLDGVASDVVWDPKTTRTIHVDARYMLWVMDKLDNADRLLKEMGVMPQLK